jgi:DNA-directed RNA polymerase specialized sigma24 family protein
VESAPGTDGPATASLQLIRLAQGGDREALGRLVERYEARLRLIVRARLGPTLRGYLDSGDILQETWAAAVQSFDRFEARDEGSLVHWLARLVENRIRQAAEHEHAQRRERGGRGRAGGYGALAVVAGGRLRGAAVGAGCARAAHPRAARRVRVAAPRPPRAPLGVDRPRRRSALGRRGPPTLLTGRRGHPARAAPPGGPGASGWPRPIVKRTGTAGPASPT